ncbi:YbaN family protein [Hyphomonas sp. WL0036]|uniref:YbaN family protein n=1 Tax=Hyphomonas sediminis TaxID=2866160 RepID=UPI001C81225C|nr:YbaN family protein [Hyphomonas sediminis]MBY9067022.1 YbaN family protein [Hyphomonas sediminis]
MSKPFFILIGLVFTGLAILGAILPGMPTTVFLIVALWAFARSSEKMTRWLENIPILRTALKEARRFEERRAVRPQVKRIAVGFAWGSAALTAGMAQSFTKPVVLIVGLAAVAASVVMILIPTDREPPDKVS